MLYSPRRLEAVFGAPLDSVTFAQIEAVAGDPAARETDDLDYKREIKSGEEGNHDIAVDVATFANHRGGLIVVGMIDDQRTAIPVKAADMPVSDGLRRHVERVAADRIQRMPRFDVRIVEDPKSPPGARTGFLLISVPPSPSAPHAVFDPRKKDGPMWWPRRHGSGKIWMSESDIEAAYRRRFAASADLEGRLVELARDAANAVHGASGNLDQAMLTITLVPDTPGDMILDSRSLQEFAASVHTDEFTIGRPPGSIFDWTGVARRRLVAQAGAGGSEMFRADLYVDGAGTFVIPVSADIDGPTADVVDTEIVIGVTSALRYLGRHARDRTGAAGAALLRVALTNHRLRPLVVRTPRPQGYTSPIGDDTIRPSGAHGESVALLDDLADDGQPLARATAALVGDLFHTFGVPEIRQIQRDGMINPGAWQQPEWLVIKSWATQKGIPIAGSQ
ncbi:ATP-binding protein [Sphaerisporangium sp. NPDC088356]|uniref:AlbA family DNA-binding domain-containing protein n=1 Tax=Sphaerisporangium sp. NPDC088356 TaxID=3154871 RepID=UPI00341B54C0